MASKKILVIGSGGREHTLVWKMHEQHPEYEYFAAPGNPGIDEIAECVPIDVSDIEALIDFIVENDVQLTVVGPEDPLASGIVEQFQRYIAFRNLDPNDYKIFGPSAGAAQLESDKDFALRMMHANNIPTGKFQTFTLPRQALDYASAILDYDGSVVIKANGLCAGKGVRVCDTEKEVWDAVHDMLIRHTFGDAGDELIVMERLYGEEASITAFVDGEHIAYLHASQDHKARDEGDKGPNTGGMGAYAPAPVVTPEIQQQVHDRIVAPMVKAISEYGTPYKGVLYGGLMITDEGPKVIEWNCRFGDPETQVVLPLLESDLVEIMLACCEGRLNEIEMKLHEDAAAVCVVMASGGYPGDYETGKIIRGMGFVHQRDKAMAFHAGTKEDDDGFLATDGGRVLGVTARRSSIKEAVEAAYTAVGCISFEGAYFRKDIAHRALDRE